MPLMRIAREFIKMACAQSIQYRSELFVWIVLTIINTLALLLAWASIIKTSQNQGQYDLAGITQYYFIITFLNTLTAAHFESWRSNEIKDGKIDTHLTKPISYPLQILLQDIGGKCIWFSISIPLLIFTYIGLSSFMSGLSISIDVTTGLQLIALLIFGYWLEFCIALCIVITTFWFESAEGLQHFKWLIISLFSGFIIPISFMPTWLKTITQFLPLKYLYAVPAALLQGTTTLMLSDWMYIAGTTIFITLCTYVFWNRAQRFYASAGG